MRKILLSALTLALLTAGWCQQAEAGPLRKAASGAKHVAGKVVRGAGKVLRRVAHPF